MLLGKQKRVGHTERPKQIAEPRQQIPLPPAPPAAGLTLLAFFLRQSVNGAPGQMLLPEAGGNLQIGVPLPGPASMTGGWVQCITAGVVSTVGAQTWTVEVNVTRGGVTTATGIKAQITGTTLSLIEGHYSLQPNDVLTVLDSKSGALNAVGGYVWVWGRLESRPAGAMA